MLQHLETASRCPIHLSSTYQLTFRSCEGLAAPAAAPPLPTHRVLVSTGSARHARRGADWLSKTRAAWCRLAQQDTRGVAAAGATDARETAGLVLITGAATGPGAAGLAGMHCGYELGEEVSNGTCRGGADGLAFGDVFRGRHGDLPAGDYRDSVQASRASGKKALCHSSARRHFHLFSLFRSVSRLGCTRLGSPASSGCRTVERCAQRRICRSTVSVVRQVVGRIFAVL